MRNFLAFLILVCLGGSAWAGARAYRVTGSSVNIRSESNEKSEVITALPKDSIVEIYERDEKPAVVKVAGVSGSWLYESGTSGYIFSAYLEPAGDSFKIAVDSARECILEGGFLDCGAEFGGKRKLAANVVILMADYSAGFEYCCKGFRPPLIQKGFTKKKIVLSHMGVSAIVNAANEVVTITGSHGGHGCPEN